MMKKYPLSRFLILSIYTYCLIYTHFCYCCKTVKKKQVSAHQTSNFPFVVNILTHVSSGFNRLHIFVVSLL